MDSPTPSQDNHRPNALNTPPTLIPATAGTESLDYSEKVPEEEESTDHAGGQPCFTCYRSTGKPVTSRESSRWLFLNFESLSSTLPEDRSGGVASASRRTAAFQCGGHTLV
ncbi:hypothetical protein Q5P01_016230 [Channa striata]|uniref:Uncharacterized protein n=1 Tax=Channa striata TaxID=64152 RepID=A0AA88MFV5_CHASR|nr:hypothetical protein Q5P01_016230 [Channa striata]